MTISTIDNALRIISNKTAAAALEVNKAFNQFPENLQLSLDYSNNSDTESAETLEQSAGTQQPIENSLLTSNPLAQIDSTETLQPDQIQSETVISPETHLLKDANKVLVDYSRSSDNAKPDKPEQLVQSKQGEAVNVSLFSQPEQYELAAEKVQPTANPLQVDITVNPIKSEQKLDSVALSNGSFTVEQLRNSNPTERSLENKENSPKVDQNLYQTASNPSDDEVLTLPENLDVIITNGADLDTKSDDVIKADNQKGYTPNISQPGDSALPIALSNGSFTVEQLRNSNPTERSLENKENSPKVDQNLYQTASNPSDDEVLTLPENLDVIITNGADLDTKSDDVIKADNQKGYTPNISQPGDSALPIVTSTNSVTVNQDAIDITTVGKAGGLEPHQLTANTFTDSLLLSEPADLSSSTIIAATDKVPNQNIALTATNPANEQAETISVLGDATKVNPANLSENVAQITTIDNSGNISNQITNQAASDRTTKNDASDISTIGIDVDETVKSNLNGTDIISLTPNSRGGGVTGGDQPISEVQSGTLIKSDNSEESVEKVQGVSTPGALAANLDVTQENLNLSQDLNKQVDTTSSREKSTNLDVGLVTSASPQLVTSADVTQLVATTQEATDKGGAQPDQLNYYWTTTNVDVKQQGSQPSPIRSSPLPTDSSSLSPNPYLAPGFAIDGIDYTTTTDQLGAVEQPDQTYVGSPTIYNQTERVINEDSTALNNREISTYEDNKSVERQKLDTGLGAESFSAENSSNTQSFTDDAVLVRGTVIIPGSDLNAAANTYFGASQTSESTSQSLTTDATIKQSKTADDLTPASNLGSFNTAAGDSTEGLVNTLLTTSQSENYTTSQKLTSDSGISSSSDDQMLTSTDTNSSSTVSTSLATSQIVTDGAGTDYFPNLSPSDQAGVSNVEQVNLSQIVAEVASVSLPNTTPNIGESNSPDYKTTLPGLTKISNQFGQEVYNTTPLFSDLSTSDFLQTRGYAFGGKVLPPISNSGSKPVAPSDTVPAMLTPGEFVVNAKDAQKNLPLLQLLNEGKSVEEVVGAEERTKVSQSKPDTSRVLKPTDSAFSAESVKVPVMLTPGEFVINSEATQENLNLLQNLNKGSDVTNNSEQLTNLEVGKAIAPPQPTVSRETVQQPTTGEKTLQLDSAKTKETVSTSKPQENQPKSVDIATLPVDNAALNSDPNQVQGYASGGLVTPSSGGTGSPPPPPPPTTGGTPSQPGGFDPQQILRLAQFTKQAYAEAEALTRALGVQANTVQKALIAMKALTAAGADYTTQVDFLRKALGITQSQFDTLTAKQEEYAEAQKQVELNSPQRASKVASLAKSTGQTFQEADDLSVDLQLPPEVIEKAVQSVDKLKKSGADVNEQFQLLNDTLGINLSQFEEIDRVQTEAEFRRIQSAEAIKRAKEAALAIAKEEQELARRPAQTLKLAQATKQPFQEAERFSQSVGLNPATILEALNAIKQLQQAGASLIEQQSFLNTTLGITDTQFQELIATQGSYTEDQRALAEQTASDAQAIAQQQQAEKERINAAKAAQQKNSATISLASSTGLTFDEAAQKSQSIGLDPAAIQQGLAVIDQLNAVNADAATQYQVLSSSIDLTEDQFAELQQLQQELASQSSGDGGGFLGSLRDNAKGVFDGVSKIGFAFQGVQAIVATFRAQLSGAYDKLVQQNVTLQEQLLGTQASLAATNKVIANGLEIKDPTKAIQALEKPLADAIARLRESSLDLVGVTSADLIPIFQFIAQESANIGASLSDSSDLTVSFAAAMGTLKIPLFQAQQEILSILQGQISMDSQLAKNIGLNNEMVNKWKAQGVLVERLNERLAAFASGNKLAAQTIDGIGSNIQEILDEVTRLAGEPLLDPIVKQLGLLYDFLKDNKEELAAVISDAINFFLTVGDSLALVIEGLKPVFESLASIGLDTFSAAGQLAASVINSLIAVLVAMTPVLASLLGIILPVIEALAEFAATDVGQILLQVVLSVTLLSNSLVVLKVTLVAANVVLTLFTTALAASGGGLVGFLVALTKVYPGLVLFTAMVAKAGGGIVGFTAALGASLLPIVVAAAPFVGLAIAVGSVLALISAGMAEDKQRAINEYGKQFNTVADNALKTSQALKNLNDTEKITGKLTEEETKKRDQLRKVAGNQVELIKAQVAELKKFNQANPNDQTKVQISLAERYIKMLENQSGATKTAARDVEDLGNTYEQMGNLARDAQAKLNYDGLSKAQAATTADYQKAADDLLKITTKAYELGQLSATNSAEIGKRSSEIVITRLEQIRDDTKLTYETQLAAQQEITKVRQIEVDKQVAGVEIQQSKIQSLISGEVVSQQEGQRRISLEKEKQLNIQTEALRKQLTEEIELRRRLVEGNSQETKESITRIQSEIATIEAKGTDDKLSEQDRANKLRLQSELNYLQEVAKQKSLVENVDKELIDNEKKRAEITKKIRDDEAAGKKANPDDVSEARRLRAVTDQLNAKKESAQASLKEETKSQTDIKNNISKNEAAIASEQKARLDASRQERLKDYDEQLQETDSLYSRYLITQEEFNLKSRDLAVAKAKDELNQLSELAKTTTDKEGLEVIGAKQSVLFKEIEDIEEKYLADRAKNKQTFLDVELKQLEANYAEGNVSTAEYNDQSFELARERTTNEIAEINRIRAYTRSDDAVRIAELDAREAEVRSRFQASQEKLRQEQVSQLELAQKESLQVVKESEIERLTTISQLESDLAIKREEADVLKGEAARETAEAEIELEKEKLDQLEALQPLDNEQMERERLLNLAGLRLSIAQRTKSLIDDEVQQRERLYNVIADRLSKEQKQLQNIATEKQQAIQKETQLQSFLKTSLDQQNQLLNARKDLVSSTQNFLTGQLSILSQTTKNSREQKAIAEAEAQIRLNSVQSQFETERLLLDLKIQQRDLALEQQKIQLESQAIAAQAEGKQAEIELRKLEARRKQGLRVSDDEFEIARLNIEGNQIKQSGIAQQQVGLERQGQINQVLDQQELLKLNREEVLASDKARLDLANNRVRRSDRRRDIRELREDIGERLDVENLSGEGISRKKIVALGRNFDPGRLQLPRLLDGNGTNQQDTGRRQEVNRSLSSFDLQENKPLEATRVVEVVVEKLNVVSDKSLESSNRLEEASDNIKQVIESSSSLSSEQPKIKSQLVSEEDPLGITQALGKFGDRVKNSIESIDLGDGRGDIAEISRERESRFITSSAYTEGDEKFRDRLQAMVNSGGYSGESLQELQATLDEVNKNIQGGMQGSSKVKPRLKPVITNTSDRTIVDTSDRGNSDIPPSQSSRPRKRGINQLQPDSTDPTVTRRNKPREIFNPDKIQPVPKDKVPTIITPSQRGDRITTRNPDGSATPATITQTYNVYFSKDDAASGKAAENFTQQVRKELKETLLMVGRK